MLEPPFVVHRDQRADGVEVVTSVPIEDFFKMQEMSDRLAAATLAGDAQSKAMAEGIIQKALSDRPELRGYSVVMGYLLKNSLEKLSGARQMPQQPQQASAWQQAPSGQQVGAPPDSGGAWGISAPPVGGGAPMPRAAAPAQVQGVRSYSRQVSGGGGGGGQPRAVAGGGGRGKGVTAGAQNVKRQAGGFKTYSRSGGPAAPLSPQTQAMIAAARGGAGK